MLLKSGIWVVISAKKGDRFMKQKKIWAFPVLLSAVLTATEKVKNLVGFAAGAVTVA